MVWSGETTGDVAALLADLDPEDAVGELEPHVIVATEEIGERRLAVAASPAQRRGEGHCLVGRRSQDRCLECRKFGRARHEAIGEVAGHPGHARGIAGTLQHSDELR